MVTVAQVPATACSTRSFRSGSVACVNAKARCAGRPMLSPTSSGIHSPSARPTVQPSQCADPTTRPVVAAHESASSTTTSRLSPASTAAAEPTASAATREEIVSSTTCEVLSASAHVPSSTVTIAAPAAAPAPTLAASLRSAPHSSHSSAAAAMVVALLSTGSDVSTRAAMYRRTLPWLSSPTSSLVSSQALGARSALARAPHSAASQPANASPSSAGGTGNARPDASRLSAKAASGQFTRHTPSRAASSAQVARTKFCAPSVVRVRAVGKGERGGRTVAESGVIRPSRPRDHSSVRRDAGVGASVLGDPELAQT